MNCGAFNSHIPPIFSIFFFPLRTGGEVTCSEISCYIRDDCKPRYMKGVCCPTYDNCPPLGKYFCHYFHLSFKSDFYCVFILKKTT